MRVLLFFAALVALVCVVNAQVPCNNPFRRLVNEHHWGFAYRAIAALDETTNSVCPSVSNTLSCCDGTVYDALVRGWLKLYADVVAMRVHLGILQFHVNILLAEVAGVKQDINNHPFLTPQEKAALTNFLDAVAAAVGPLVPTIAANFGRCYSSVLRFYAGLLCRACDPDWDDWVFLNGTDPNNDVFDLRFAPQTCTTLQDECYPFFAPLFEFARAIFDAAEALANHIPDNTTRALVLDHLDKFEPPCLDRNDCLYFVCYRFLVGLNRYEGWVEGFHNQSGGGDDRRRFVTDSAIGALNRVQRSVAGVVRAARDTPVTGQNYEGTFNPFAVQTGLTTDAGSDSSSAAHTQSAWFDLLL